jgi:hypothetical protein
MYCQDTQPLLAMRMRWEPQASWQRLVLVPSGQRERAESFMPGASVECNSALYLHEQSTCGLASQEPSWGVTMECVLLFKTRLSLTQTGPPLNSLNRQSRAKHNGGNLDMAASKMSGLVASSGWPGQWPSFSKSRTEKASLPLVQPPWPDGQFGSRLIPSKICQWHRRRQARYASILY